MRPGKLIRLAGAVALMLSMPTHAFVAPRAALNAVLAGRGPPAGLCGMARERLGSLLLPAVRVGACAPGAATTARPHRALCTMLAESSRRTAYPGGRGGGGGARVSFVFLCLQCRVSCLVLFLVSCVCLCFRLQTDIRPKCVLAQ